MTKHRTFRLMAEDMPLLQRLSPERLAIVDAVDVQGKKYVVAAADLGIPVGTVRSGLNRARSAIVKMREEAACATS